MNTNNNKLFANAQMRKQTDAVALRVVTLRRLPFIILSYCHISASEQCLLRGATTSLVYTNDEQASAEGGQ